MKRRSGFTLIELLITVAVMLILAVVGMSNYVFSIKKSHDSVRKSDLATIAKGLEAFASDWGYYPPDDGGGKMVACQLGAGALYACDWGSPFAANFNGSVQTYLAKMPKDPVKTQTYYYKYDSLTGKYNLYAGLENTADPSYKATAYDCGNVVCSYTLTESGLQ